MTEIVDFDEIRRKAIEHGLPMDEHGRIIENPEPQRDWSQIVRDLDLRGDLVKRFFRPREQGLRLPWEPFHDAVQFAPGRWTVWSGVTFSGKTNLLRQLALHSARSGQKVFFASLEEEPDEIRDAFTIMAAQTWRPSAEFVESFGLWSRDRIMIAETLDMFTIPELIDMLKEAAYTRQCKQIFVDSLMRLKLRVDDYDGQRMLGNTLSKFCKQYRVHVHLVCHPRKTQSSREPLDIYDIRGAGDLINQADNIIVMHRKYDAEIPNPTNALAVKKNRGLRAWVGDIGLFYHLESKQFLAEHGARPMQFMDWYRYPATPDE